MKFLTEKQKQWLTTKTIKVGGLYTFPSMGFHIYPKPEYLNGEFMDTNPFTKSLGGELFKVKEIENGFCKGNFATNPKRPDVYLSESELSNRGLMDMLLLFLISFIPLSIYNLIRGGVGKIEQTNNQKQNK